MGNDTPAVKDNVQPAAPAPTAVVPPAVDYEALYHKKAEESENWKTAALKYKERAKGVANGTITETEDERIQRIVDEKIANSELTKAEKEKDELLIRVLNENKELKLAQLNKPDVPASSGSHSESLVVTDTLITPDQMAQLKKMYPHWTDKDFERYKKNLRRQGVR
jgi:hypothetical protein